MQNNLLVSISYQDPNDKSYIEDSLNKVRQQLNPSAYFTLTSKPNLYEIPKIDIFEESLTIDSIIVTIINSLKQNPSIKSPYKLHIHDTRLETLKKKLPELNDVLFY